MIKWPWKAQEITQNEDWPWDDALAIPLLVNLTAQEQARLIALAERFLQQKRLVALQGFELDSLKSARIALIFCLPILELGIEWLDGFHEVLIYPAPFVVDDEWEDDIGLVHSQRVVQSGQSWQQGPIILNWLDIQDSFDASGFNLIIHEVAHKLDMRNGDRASGIPFIPLRDVAGWEHDLHAAMNNIQDEIDLVGKRCQYRCLCRHRPCRMFCRVVRVFFQRARTVCSTFPGTMAAFLPVLSPGSFSALTGKRCRRRLRRGIEH